MTGAPTPPAEQFPLSKKPTQVTPISLIDVDIPFGALVWLVIQVTAALLIVWVPLGFVVGFCWSMNH